MVTVRSNPGAARELLSTPQTRAALDATARAFASSVQATTPVRTGRSRRSIRSDRPEMTPRGLVARVYSTSPFFHLIEWGSVNNPIYAPFRRGAARLGLKVRVVPKGGGG